MSGAREELHQVVDALPEDQVRAVLDDARRRARPVPLDQPGAWRPAWFGAGNAGCPDVSERAEELLAGGFGSPR